MKLFKALAVLTLSACTTAGIVAATSLESVEPVLAASTDSYGIIGTFPGNNWSSDYATSTWNGTDHVIQCTIGAGVSFKIRTAGTWGGAVDVGSDLAKRYSQYFEASSDNAMTKAAGTYTFTIKDGITTYGDKSYGIIVAYSDVTEYAVNEYAVVDGVKEAEPFATTSATSGVTFAVENQYRRGYNFEGWYTDEACETAYVAGELSEDTNLYAKFTTDANPAKVYFATKDWDNVYVYTYGGNKSCGAWPGAKLESSDLIIMVHIGDYDLYEVKLPSNTTDTKLIFNNGEGSQTKNFNYVANDYYYVAGTADVRGSENYGIAVAFLKKLNDFRNSADSYSICNISQENRASLLSEYNDFSAEVKAIIDDATIYTWSDETKSSESFISVRAIMEQFGSMQSGSSGLGFFGFNSASNSNDYLYAVIACSFIVVIAFASFTVIRRRKHN